MNRIKPAPQYRQPLTNLAFALLVLALAVAVMPAVANTTNADAIPEIIEISNAVASTPAGGQLSLLQQQYRDEISSGNLEQALESAKQIVTGSSVIWGDQSEQVASALTNLAITQADSGNFAAAQENYVAAISLRETLSGGIVDASLVNPLRGLASASMALNNVEQAIPIFERAIHLSHVNQGPNNLDQIDVMDALSRAYFFLGELRNANKVQDNMFRLQRRQFERDSDQYIDALLKRARWYGEVADAISALQAYKNVLSRMARTYGETDKRLIEPLVEMAFISIGTSAQEENVNQAQLINEKERAMSRAVRIARSYSEEDPVLYAQTLAKRGDFFTSNNQSTSARRPYKEAWATLSQTPATINVRNELFADPKPVRVIPIRRTYKRIPRNSPGEMSLYQDRGFVLVSFSINAAGRPLAISVVDSEPAGLMDTTVVRGVRAYRFRPAFVNGKAVRRDNQTFRHEFRYSEERLKPKERDRIAKTEALRAEARAEVVIEAAPVSEPPGDNANDQVDVESLDQSDPGSTTDTVPLGDIADEQSALDVADQSTLAPAADADPAVTSDDQ